MVLSGIRCMMVPEGIMNIISKTLLPAIAVLALCGVNAPAAEDLVWKTYSQVVHPGDDKMTCAQLREEIDVVSRDIIQQDKTRRSIEAALRSSFDMASYGRSRSVGTSRAMAGTGSSGNEHNYTRIRDEIVASKKVAVERRNHLRNLLLFCKDQAPAAR